ncbi:cupin domain-containing protein [Dysgonomonas macrotermitis]|uniref:Cupin domain-containing protein n=1 Tax=Dysgonomonas macrotermitis TaxID=1346286 RepID=A0A1M5AJ47_9BACT|nr:cupin domain-containing protein [Dysgonomonas macrotermitis]SHF30340.1 Cupin domain-containing protein [Dysgonomonas macrotermitis]
MNKILSRPFFISSCEPVYVVDKGVTRQFIGYTNDIMTVKVFFEKGAIGYTHSHPHVQTAYIDSGKFEVTIGNETQILEAGDGFVAEPNIEHGVVCLEAGIIIDTFNPIREDFYATINK